MPARKRNANLARLLACMALSLVVIPAAHAENTGLIVSAAASLTDTLETLKPDAERAIGGTLLFNFGGSGALRRQIEAGAPVDVFFSAASDEMDTLEKQALIVPGSRKELLGNRIVLIGGQESAPVSDINALRHLLESARLLAVGNPDTVPAGRYAMEALEHYGLASSLRGRLVMGGSVREVLAYVRIGSAPLGIVFLTDARSVQPGSSVRQLFLFPPEALREVISYPVALVSSSKSRVQARKFLDFLQGPLAQETFKSAGFILQ